MDLSYNLMAFPDLRYTFQKAKPLNAWVGPPHKSKVLTLSIPMAPIRASDLFEEILSPPWQPSNIVGIWPGKCVNLIVLEYEYSCPVRWLGALPFVPIFDDESHPRVCYIYVVTFVENVASSPIQTTLTKSRTLDSRDSVSLLRCILQRLLWSCPFSSSVMP